MGHSLDVLFDNTKMTNEMLTDIDKKMAKHFFGTSFSLCDINPER